MFRFVQGKLPDEALARVDEHLAVCPDCRQVVAEASQYFGAHVGRYRIDEALGAGAGGFVYRGFDPQLQRPVAVKLIAAPADTSSSAPAQARLLREARAMAKLAHPNVVAVHDAGLFEDQVFVVMEMVEGQTIRGWLAARPRAWTEIIDVFLEAGLGLAAAHEAGLVHRDFKPDNVLIGADGRARVTDFGLAQPAGLSASDGSAIVGTPAYMAPEQFRGRETDARTDQFSFCVALYHALYGQRPFGPLDNPAEALPLLARDVVAGRLRPPPDGTQVPPALFTVLRRGMSVDPGDRFPGLRSLLTDLRGVRQEVTAPRPRGRLALRALGALAIAVVVGAVALWRSGAGAGPGRCGNGRVDPGEECDDGNRNTDDGCTNQCLACVRSATAFAWRENDHCYTRNAGPATWDEARAACGAVGADLVTFTNRVESSAVGEAFADTPLWMGFRAQARSDRTRWITGEAFFPGWSRWAPDEPRADGAVPRCGLQARSTLPGRPPFEWTTDDCSARHGFICERAGWTSRPRTTHAYRLFSRPSPWQDAQAACERAGAHLVTISDADEQAFVATMALDTVWIGATDTAVEGRFAWVNGEPFLHRGFAPSEPDDRDGKSDCAAMGPDKLWHDRGCSSSYAFVCEGE